MSNLTFEQRVDNALRACVRLSEVDYVEKMIHSSDMRPNYRIKANRELKEKMLDKVNEKRLELQKTENPF